MSLSTRRTVWKKIQIQGGALQDGDEQQHQTEDDWADAHAAHRRLGDLWTGYTEFRLKPSGLDDEQDPENVREGDERRERIVDTPSILREEDYWTKSGKIWRQHHVQW